MADLIEGYEAEIYQALWKRPMYLGAPRLWTSFWLALCMYLGLLVMVAAGLRWVAVPGVAWLVGQGVLVGLTRWDSQWDNLLIAQWTRRYRSTYRAG